MAKATKDLPYNNTQNIQVEGQLVKRQAVKKPTLTDIYNIVVENKETILKLDKRIDNLVAKNNLQE